MTFFERWFGRARAREKPYLPPQGWVATPRTAEPAPAPAPPVRHYLADADYLLPKDAEEDLRLNFQHHALFHALGNHYVAPVHPPLYAILDIGTGTGIWAEEMARFFPATLVVGVDLSTSSFRPPAQENCLLRPGNVLTGLPFPDEFFCFTHQRLLIAGIPAANWPQAIREIVRVTRVQGWLELIETASLPEQAGPATARVQQVLEAVSRQLGFDGTIIRQLGDLLRQEGVQEVAMQPIRVPVGAWAGRVGTMMQQDVLAATTALRERACTHAGLTGSEFDQMVQAMEREWQSTQPFLTFYAAYGKRGTS